MTNKSIIMRESDEAAQYKTVTGWVSRDGFFYGENESTARYAGCTHQLCDGGCGAVVEKCYVKCKECRAKDRIAKFDAMPTQQWDGETPLVVFDTDRYFFHDRDLMDYCFDEGVQPQDLRLMICEPQMARPLDYDYYCDELPEDGDIPDKIAEAMEAYNEAIKKCPPLSWIEGKFAAVIPAKYSLETESTHA